MTYMVTTTIARLRRRGGSRWRRAPFSRSVCVATIALVLGSAGERSVGAEESSVFPVERKHTLSVRKHRLRGVLNHLFARTGVRWHIEKNVPDVRITIRFRRVSLQQGLRLI